MKTMIDPVKYPDSISPNFKSFLKGLLNKVLFSIRLPVNLGCSAVVFVVSLELVSSASLFRFKTLFPILKANTNEACFLGV